jgi:hypothetical protein
MCDGLTNQSYYIHGQQLTKEEYEVKKSQILAQKDQFPQFVAQITKE